ncbi:NERD domain-containing protein [Pseudoalteromonas sp. C2R02]|uniref:nuclease-related domain-containing protein n=1 Tax=Pseudoalteromonas sp. C2R02 TaxID=2841565 RepID=UPI001C09C659|nr:nuclease-related domain-containing protein [Pseudoalteromonas sp. C2R02]MBU2968252.1 NERD domain-containing protein [Pseudoalteromonas sp. C2R02]
MLVLLFSHSVYAVEQQTEATCILLKQQVAMYSNNRLHKNYRQSKKLLDSACINPEQISFKKFKLVDSSISKTAYNKPQTKPALISNIPSKVAENKQLNIFSLFPTGQIIALFTLLISFGVLSIIVRLNSAKIKGFLAERLVNKYLGKLNTNDYTVYKNLILSLENDDLTEVDHLVVSQYGIFVIETKNYAGWIFGSQHQAKWTQQIYKKKSQFQNPLRQNYKHCLAVGKLLGLVSNIKSVVVFTERAEFKIDMPSNVIKIGELLGHFYSFEQVKFTEKQVIEFNQKLRSNVSKTSRADRKAHLTIVKNKGAEPYIK